MTSEQEQLGPGRRLPVAMREVPDSWWRALFDGQRWYISTDEFAVKATTLPNIRLFAYRRAEALSLHVATMLQTSPRRLYIRATREPNYRKPIDWGPAQPAPPMHTISETGSWPMDESLIKALVNVFRAHGYEVNPPKVAMVEPEPPPPYVPPVLPVPPGWSRSVHTGGLLPPGALDVKGAVYEDGMSKQEIVEMSYEFAEIAKKCSCGTADLRRHEPSCQAWIS